jgi:hypothetical protein
MKKQILATIALLMTTAISVNAYYNDNDYRPHTLPGRTVDAAGNVVEGTGRVAGDVVEGTGRVAGGVVEGTGSFLGGIFTGKSREERHQEKENRRQQREQEREERAARRNR